MSAALRPPRPLARPNWLDRAIGVVAPRAALRRATARAELDASRAYEGASRGRRTEGWNPRGTSADADLMRSLVTLRARVRDLERNNPHARKAKSVWTNNLIAWGIEPRPISGDPERDARVRALWDEWADHADADGQLDINGLQELMVSTMVSGGEALVRRRWRRPEDGLRVPVQIQVLEGDHLDITRTGPTGGGHTVIQGVEMDAIGQRRAYWLYPEHPGHSGLTGRTTLQSRPVPASEIAHVYRKERTQTRGAPWGAAVVLKLRDLDDYEVAEIVRKKTEACVVAIVLGAEEGDEGIAPSVTDANGQPVEQFEPGLIAYAHGGKEVKFHSPSATGGYETYRAAGLHTVAAGYLVPYELLTGDLSQVNFASSRVGIIEFRRLVTTIQWLTVIPMGLNPIWRWFCEAAFLAGELDVPFVPVEWQPPAFDSINPIDDANAAMLRMRAGTLSWDEAVAETGRDPDAVMEEIAARLRAFDKRGLIFDIDPRKVSRAGLTQARAEGTELPDTTPHDPDAGTTDSRQAQESWSAGHLRPVK